MVRLLAAMLVYTAEGRDALADALLKLCVLSEESRLMALETVRFRHDPFTAA
jgi:hypothetical protein